MRRTVVGVGLALVAAMSVSGCAVPVTVAAAGYAMSGFTLMDQGKTVSDIVLSAAMDQDCAMWRIIQDQPICIEVLEDGSLLAEAETDFAGQVADVAGKAPKSTTSLD